MKKTFCHLYLYTLPSPFTSLHLPCYHCPPSHYHFFLSPLHWPPFLRPYKDFSKQPNVVFLKSSMGPFYPLTLNPPHVVSQLFQINCLALLTTSCMIWPCCHSLWLHLLHPISSFFTVQACSPLFAHKICQAHFCPRGIAFPAPTTVKSHPWVFIWLFLSHHLDLSSNVPSSKRTSLTTPTIAYAIT